MNVISLKRKLRDIDAKSCLYVEKIEEKFQLICSYLEEKELLINELKNTSKDL